MNKPKTLLISSFISVVLLSGFANADDHSPTPPQFTPGIDIEAFWISYSESKGGLTWGRTDTYPEYSQVKEGDTLLIEVKQGPCLMEFFHSRWRRANDVRRWNPSVNEYGGCPYVFD
jgi:hypothetical protein